MSAPPVAPRNGKRPLDVKRFPTPGVLAATTALALMLAGCGAGNETADSGTGSADAGVSGTISGAGSSAQAAAVDAWKAGFESANPDATVNYDPVGSGGGREQFLSGAVAFAGSDAYLSEEELAKLPADCGELIELPAYVSPIAVAYNLKGVDNLQLSASTIAKIFDQKIKTWNDPAIAADNPGVTLPATAIIPVNRSDESGTTSNFTDYLAAAAPADWTYKPGGAWPVAGGTAAKGTTGVVEAIGANDGSIGYADESQIGELKAAKVKVGDAYVEITPEAAAKIVDASQRVPGRGTYDYAITLQRDTTDSGTYPIVLVSYELACTTYKDPATAALVKAWLTHITSEEGQQAAAKAAGSAPLSETGRSNAKTAIDAIVTT